MGIEFDLGFSVMATMLPNITFIDPQLCAVYSDSSANSKHGVKGSWPHAHWHSDTHTDTGTNQIFVRNFNLLSILGVSNLSCIDFYRFTVIFGDLAGQWR